MAQDPTFPMDDDIRQRIKHAIDHLDHVLPGQAPILNFVHHNTLHGYQHLHFVEALAEAERKTGIRGYLPEAEFRKLYQAGRIDDEDLEVALAGVSRLSPVRESSGIAALDVSQDHIDHLSFTRAFDALTAAELAWQIDDMGALRQWQPDLAPPTRERLQTTHKAASESQAIHDLWISCLRALDLELASYHPEDSGEIIRSDAENLAAEFGNRSQPIMGDVCPIHPDIHHQLRKNTERRLTATLGALGPDQTLREFMLALTGQDLLRDIRPQLIRYCASHLDEGLASWVSPDRVAGLYATWRKAAHYDLGLEFAGIPDWQQRLRDLPDDALDAIVASLDRLGLPPDHWCAYLERIALEIPGWSGIINWRQQRPDYKANQTSPVSLVDYLAVRLILDGLHLDRLARATWDIDCNLNSLTRYFRANLSEFHVREALFSGQLPEFLAAAAQDLISISGAERSNHADWRNLADMIWSWQRQPAATTTHTPHGSGWRLFRMAQHLGLTAECLHQLSHAQVEEMLHALDRLTADQRSHVWLQAYENNYRKRLFAALTQNHDRGRWQTRDRRPQAQVVFCMDDREESIRRHLEELNPAIETLGAAGFFGVPINWRGLDDTEITPLCPVVVTPSHEVREQATAEAAPALVRHGNGLKLKQVAALMLHQELRRNLFSSHLLINLLGPFTLALLGAKIFAPYRQNRLMRALERRLVPPVTTGLVLTAPPDSPPATPDRPRLGFTDAEQADRVAGFLRIIGLTSGFAPLVVIAGHGSISQNNPHLAAYDCGACSGRHGGPNARAFAAMANRQDVRRLVAEKGIVIPDDTWFVGSEHNTANEDLIWFDLDAMPPGFKDRFAELRTVLDQSLYLSAHERCRRLASAPRTPSLKQAMKHMLNRTTDISQARPELGHATNAAALIGRRSVTQGTFLDRRVFLISYDPTIDPEGRILEGILLAAGPVGAGISLEYYFSTVNNERFGCGTKVPHNVTGLFAVMEGGSSDLRTGLPRQMIEIHEAMRLQVIVEATIETLSAIYARQPPLRELIGNGWILLSAIHPETGLISVFEPEHGFRPWQRPSEPLPEVTRSADWYQGHSDPLTPALIARKTQPEPAHAD